MSLMNPVEESPTQRYHEEAQIGRTDVTDNNQDTPDDSCCDGSDDQSYPDGGFQAWLVVFGAWCAMFSSMGLLNTLAVLHAWVTENQLHGMAESTTAWIFSCYGFLLYFCGAQIGPLFDAYDIKVLIIPGSIGIVTSTILLSFSTEFYQFLLSLGILGGISASLLFYPAVSTISHWFLRKRSLATGICFPLIILYAAPSIGFPWAIRIVSLICVVSSMIACCLLRKRLPPNKEGGGAIDLKAFRDPKYAVITIAILITEFSLFIPYTYISSYGISKGMSLRSALMLNVLLSVGAIPGRALPGYFADRYGVLNVMVVTTSACRVLILGLWLPIRSENEAAINAFTTLFGFWSGAAIALAPVCIGQVCEAKDYGKRTGTSFFISSFGALIGIPIAGVILESGDSNYQGLIVLVGVTFVITTGTFYWAKKLLCA
ncbi:hypothetical protein FVEN_g6739 [Fusarium venenatum]|nr:hypothetical protein FVEN_g6739 [Fusarium venenatum]